MTWRKIWRNLREHPIDTAALVASLIAIVVSGLTLRRQASEHSDTLTAQVIREAYTDFITVDDIRAEYPLQSHLFEAAANYEQYKTLVSKAAVAKIGEPGGKERLLLEESAMAMRVFSMFEHSYYQWEHARKTADGARSGFLKEVLDYFTGRILSNPRLLWYWSRNGGNLVEHFEKVTIDYYDDHVQPVGKKVDGLGPFLTEATAFNHK